MLGLIELFIYISCHIFCNDWHFPSVAFMPVKDLIAGLNNRVYVKHIRGDEKKASHSRTQLGACVTGGYGKEKRQKKVVT